MVQFARPYRAILLWFLVLVVIDAVIGVINPLIFRSIIDNGHPRAQQVPDHRAGPGGGGAGHRRHRPVPRASAGSRPRSVKGSSSTCGPRSSSTSRRCPSPSSPGPRPAPSSVRLNNDVIGAQQAFTDTLSSVVSNVISVTLVLIVMFALSWQITLISLVILPGLRPAGQRVGRRLSIITRESYGTQRPDEQHHDRALQRVGRPAGQAVRPARPRSGTSSSRRPGGCATSGSPRPCTPASSSPPSPSPRRWPPPSSTAGAASRSSTAPCSSARWWPWPRT